VAVKWLIIRTAIEREPFETWALSQKMTLNLSICVLVYDLFGFVPSLVVPSFITLALSEIIRCVLRTFSVFYLLFTFNSLLRGRKILKAVVSLPSVAFSLVFFASNAVFLVSLMRRDMDHIWPVE
jgi:hypothetical protein